MTRFYKKFWSRRTDDNKKRLGESPKSKAYIDALDARHAAYEKAELKVIEDSMLAELNAAEKNHKSKKINFKI